MPWRNFDLPQQIPEVNKIAGDESTANSFVTVKARKSCSKRKKSTKNTDDKGLDATSEDGEDEESDEEEKLYFCPEEGCTQSFQRYHSLETHLDCGRHKYMIEHETLYDKAMNLYANKLEHGASTISQSGEEMNLQLDATNVLPMGWALKTTSKKKRFSDSQKKYLITFFQTGERTGQKANPSDVSKAMRTARNKDGARLFGKDDFLTPQQISSFFSRVAAKKKIDVNDEDDDLELNQHQVDLEMELEQLKSQVMDEISLQHPIMFEVYDICKLSSQSKLSSFSITMLQYICTSLDLDISSIKIKRKKPYVDLLEKLVASCTCQFNT